MLYLLIDEGNRNVKIGYTSKWEGRKASYRTCNPDAKLCDMKDGDRELEKYYHHLMDEKIIFDKINEWYKIPQNELYKIESLGFGYFDESDLDEDELIPDLNTMRKLHLQRQEELYRERLEEDRREQQRKKNILNYICESGLIKALNKEITSDYYGSFYFTIYHKTGVEYYDKKISEVYLHYNKTIDVKNVTPEELKEKLIEIYEKKGFYTNSHVFCYSWQQKSGKYCEISIGIPKREGEN